MELDGVSGAWMPDEVLRQILADRTDLDTYRLSVPLLERELEARRLQVAALADAADQADLASAKLSKSLEAAARGRREAEEALGAWYRSPLLWTGIGAGGAIAVGVLTLALAGAL